MSPLAVWMTTRTGGAGPSPRADSPTRAARATDDAARRGVRVIATSGLRIVQFLAVFIIRAIVRIDGRRGQERERPDGVAGVGRRGRGPPGRGPAAGGADLRRRSTAVAAAQGVGGIGRGARGGGDARGARGGRRRSRPGRAGGDD